MLLLHRCRAKYTRREKHRPNLATKNFHFWFQHIHQKHRQKFKYSLISFLWEISLGSRRQFVSFTEQLSDHDRLLEKNSALCVGCPRTSVPKWSLYIYLVIFSIRKLVPTSLLIAKLLNEKWTFPYHLKGMCQQFLHITFIPLSLT